MEKKLTRKEAIKIIEDFYYDRGVVSVRLEAMAVERLGYDKSIKLIRKVIRDRNHRQYNDIG